MNYKLENGVINISIDGTIYCEDVLFKCFYWYGRNYEVQISNDVTPEYFLVCLKAKDFEITDEISSELVGKIKQDLIDFKLRDIVTKETKTIRELIVAKAFAYYEEEQDPASNVSDPVGFNPENISFYE